MFLLLPWLQTQLRGSGAAVGIDEVKGSTCSASVDPKAHKRGSSPCCCHSRGSRSHGRCPLAIDREHHESVGVKYNAQAPRFSSSSRASRVRTAPSMSAMWPETLQGR